MAAWKLKFMLKRLPQFSKILLLMSFNILSFSNEYSICVLDKFSNSSDFKKNFISLFNSCDLTCSRTNEIIGKLQYKFLLSFLLSLRKDGRNIVRDKVSIFRNICQFWCDISLSRFKFQDFVSLWIRKNVWTSNLLWQTEWFRHKALRKSLLRKTSFLFCLNIGANFDVF